MVLGFLGKFPVETCMIELMETNYPLMKKKCHDANADCGENC